MSRPSGNIKQAYALGADTLSRALLARITGPARAKAAQALPPRFLELDVFNTASWPRTDLVTLPKETQGDVVKEARARRFPRSGCPAANWSSWRGTCRPWGRNATSVLVRYRRDAGNARAQGATLTTSLFTLKLDEATGAIVSSAPAGLWMPNWWTASSTTTSTCPAPMLKDVKPSGPGKITVKKSGRWWPPCSSSRRPRPAGSWCAKCAWWTAWTASSSLTRWTSLPVRKPEGLHFGFEFNVPGAVVRMNSPLAVVEPEKDQLPGACKNWFSIERWVDVANARYGVTWATVDAPMVEMGGLTANLVLSQPNPAAYMKTIKPSPKLYSWVMNNHWHTNYRADQEGNTTFRYAIRPHHGYDPIAAARFGVEATEPLIAAPASGGRRLTPPLRIEPAGSSSPPSNPAKTARPGFFACSAPPARTKSPGSFGTSRARCATATWSSRRANRRRTHPRAGLEPGVPAGRAAVRLGLLALGLWALALIPAGAHPISLCNGAVEVGRRPSDRSPRGDV